MAELPIDDALHDLPEAKLQKRQRWSIIWLVPLAAVLSGIWLAYKTWAETGPVITISFKNAAGLEAGKTKIKYKNVEIGKVQDIVLNHETMDVKVIAEMDNSFKPYLTEQTQFWVVKARIDVSGVSGLDTLLSGAYIGADPVGEGEKIRDFQGLDAPPVVTQNEPGKHFMLRAENLGSLERDAPVYYKKFNVGKIEDVRLDDEGQGVLLQIFVRAPFDRWVNKTTKFWNASGVDVSLTATGLTLETESVISILVGGVAFDSKEIGAEITEAQNLSEFTLYASKQDSLDKNYRNWDEYMLYFSESVRGLSIGAPVEFRGIQIGEVRDIQLLLDARKKEISIPVKVSIDFDKLAFDEAHVSDPKASKSHRKHVEFFIHKGIRAQLKSGNLLTGQLFVDVDFFPEAPPFDINWQAKVPEFPTVPTELKEWTHNIKDILKKVDSTMTQINELSHKLNHQLAPEMSAALMQTNASLSAIEQTLQNDSPLQQNVQLTMKEIAKAARSVKNLADYLERHPEALIQGKK